MAEIYFEEPGRRTLLAKAGQLMGCGLPEVTENSETGVFSVFSVEQLSGSWERKTLRKVDFRGVDIKVGLEKRFGSLDARLSSRRGHNMVQNLYRRRNGRLLDGDRVSAVTFEDLAAILATGAFEEYLREKGSRGAGAQGTLEFQAIQIP